MTRARAEAAALVAHSVLVQLVTFVLRPATTYRAIELDVPAAWLGALAACFAIAPLLLALPAGAVADRVGERRTAFAGGLLLTASALLLVVAGTSVPALAAGSVLLGLGHLACLVAQQTLVANASTPSGYDSAFGRYTFVASLGQALGPAAILLFSDGGTVPDTGAIFLASLAVGAVCVALSPLLGGGRGAAAPEAGGLRRLVRLPGLTRALLASCMLLAAVDITLVYLPALGVERGIAASTVALLLTVRGVASMATRFFLGPLVRLTGRRRLLVWSTVLSAVSLGGTALPAPVWVLALLMTLAGLGLGAGQPLTMAWIAETAPPGLRGRAMSLRLLGNRVGQVVVPSVAGAVAAGTGAAGVLLFTAASLGGVAVATRRLPVGG